MSSSSRPPTAIPTSPGGPKPSRPGARHLAFEKHRVIEIGASDEVVCAHLVRVVEAAKNAGFVDWNLTDPTSLSNDATR